MARNDGRDDGGPKRADRREQGGDFSDLFSEALRAQDAALRGDDEGLPKLYGILADCLASGDPQLLRFAGDVWMAIRRAELGFEKPVKVEAKMERAGKPGKPVTTIVERALRRIERLAVRIFLFLLVVVGLWFAFDVHWQGHRCGPSATQQKSGSVPGVDHKGAADEVRRLGGPILAPEGRLV